MKRFLLLIGFLASYALSVSADTLFVSSHERVNMVWHESYDRTAYFPTKGKEYRRVLMYYTLSCATTGCSDWDYDVLTYIMHEPGEKDSSVSSLDTVSTNPLVVDTTWNVFNKVEPYELGRYITPYGSYMNYRNGAYRTAGFDSSWKHTFVYDVTDYAKYLVDSVRIRTKYNGWSSGFGATIRFAFIEGTPQREVLGLENIYTKGGSYQNSTQFETNVVPPVKVAIPQGATQAQLKVIVSGHGANSGTGCAEFCDRDYYVKVNGQQKFVHRMWRDDCGTVAVSPQGGTWIFSRGNWCPGDIVREQRFEITDYLEGDSIEIDLDIEPYALSGNGGASHSITTQLFFYGDDQHSFDVEMQEIIAPNNFADHSRWNPTCGNPIVVIKNNSHNTLNSARINYGPEGGLENSYFWEGSLGFEEKDTINLPAPRWTATDVNQTSFYAEIETPNYSYQDDVPDNDRRIVDFDMVPRWEPFRILMRTNGQPQENRLSITNEKGEEVYVEENLAANTLITKDLSLPNGCYELLLTDAGGDGLDFWYYRQTGQNSRTNGYLRVFKQSGGIYANFGGDFGGEVRYSFVVGQMSIPEAELIPNLELAVFPNPSDGQVFVALPEVDDEVIVSVMDNLGRTILALDNIPSDRSYWLPIDLSGLENGIYYIKALVGEQELTEKIILAQ